MMQILRKYMKQIFTVVIIAFIVTIIFSWGMGGIRNTGAKAQRGVIGSINGQDIQYQQFNRLVEQEILKAKEQSKQDELPEYQMNAIRDKAWDNIVQEILVQQEVERLNIVSSPHEVVFFMRNSPPDFVKENESFQTDGQFDMERYQEILQDERNFSMLQPLENYFRQSIPPYKLQQWILSSVRVTEDEIKKAYIAKTEKVTAKYLFWDTKNMSKEDINITDNAIQKYYNDNKDEFLTPETRKINYIAFELKPSKDDTLMLQEDILDYKALLEGGEDFDELAKEYSHDPGSAVKGGDLGYFGRGTMMKPFEEAAFNAKIDEVVGPVETSYGYHLIKVLDKKREEGETKVHAKHILRKFKMSPETREDLYKEAEYIYTNMQKNKPETFEEFLESEGFKMTTSATFPEGSHVPGIGMSTRLNHSAFREKKGWISSPVYTEKYIVVFQVAEIQKKSHKSLDKVSERIKRNLIDEQLLVKAGEVCENARERIKDGMDLEGIAMEDSLEIQEPSAFAIKDYIRGIGREPAFAATAFQLSIGEISKPVKTDKGYYLIQTTDRIEYKEESFEAMKKTEKENLIKEKQQQYLSEWFNNLKEYAEIQDFRKEFF